MRTLFAFRQELSIIMNLFKAAGILDFFRILYWRAAIIIRFLDWWRAEMGIAMIPRYSWGFQRYDTISFAHLREPALENTTWLSWPKNVPLSDTHRKFKRFAMHELAGLISP